MTQQSITDQVSGTTVPGRLRAVLAEVSATGVDGLTEVELLEVVALLEMTKGAAAAAQARATARFVEERDTRVAEMAAAEEISRREASLRRRATRSEVALARRCSPGQADRHVGAARALVHELPGTMAALTAGEISEWRATIVVRETACLAAADRLEADRRLSGCLTTLGDQGLSRAAHRVCADLDQAALVERRRRAAASRRVGVRPAPDGMAWLSVLGRSPRSSVPTRPCGLPSGAAMLPPETRGSMRSGQPTGVARVPGSPTRLSSCSPVGPRGSHSRSRSRSS